MIGLSVEDITSSNNVGLLHQQIRRKQKEKPSGRKAPRKHDFKMQSEDTDQVAKEIMEDIGHQDTVEHPDISPPKKGRKTYDSNHEKATTGNDENRGSHIHPREVSTAARAA